MLSPVTVVLVGPLALTSIGANGPPGPLVVTVYRLITKDSIEDSIVRLHEKKRGVASSLLDEGDAVAGLSADELQSLISESLSEPS